MGCMGFDVVAVASNYGGEDGGAGGASGEASYVQRLKSNRLLRLLERTLLIGGSIDAEALCVQSGVWVWRLVVDVSLTNDAGNSIDACILAAVAALRHFRLPEVDIGCGDADDAVQYDSIRETTIIHSDDKEPTPLPLHHTPLTATFALFSDESGSTTTVSALLDPTDREELACNGILTWSYNKYGEMCCLDFPGGCELSPSQLMSSSDLGKKRCIEICEMLETALVEAENKAQKERMERLKGLRPAVVPIADHEMGSDDEDVAMVDTDEVDTRAEDEQYRKIALDYASGHIAASVKEVKPSTVKSAKRDTSSLFHALLHSAKNSMETASIELKKSQAVDVEIKVVEKKKTAQNKSIQLDGKATKAQQKVTVSSIKENSDEEEEDIVQLQSEFSAIGKHTADESMTEPAAVEPKAETITTPAPKATKQKALNDKDDDIDIDDLAMAMKKKKSKKSKKK